MANTLGIDYAADAGEMVLDSGQTCTVAGVADVPCVLGAESRNIEIEPEKDETIYTRSCMIKSESVTGVPAMYAKVSAGSVGYSVIDVMYNSEEGVIVMQLSRKVNR